MSATPIGSHSFYIFVSTLIGVLATRRWMGNGSNSLRSKAREWTFKRIWVKVNHDDGGGWMVEMSEKRNSVRLKFAYELSIMLPNASSRNTVMRDCCEICAFLAHYNDLWRAAAARKPVPVNNECAGEHIYFGIAACSKSFATLVELVEPADAATAMHVHSPLNHFLHVLRAQCIRSCLRTFYRVFCCVCLSTIFGCRWPNVCEHHLLWFARVQCERWAAVRKCNRLTLNIRIRRNAIDTIALVGGAEQLHCRWFPAGVLVRRFW